MGSFGTITTVILITITRHRNEILALVLREVRSLSPARLLGSLTTFPHVAYNWQESDEVRMECCLQLIFPESLVHPYLHVPWKWWREVTQVTFSLQLALKWDINSIPLISNWEYGMGQTEDKQGDKWFQKTENWGKYMLSYGHLCRKPVIGAQSWGWRLCRAGVLNLWVAAPLVQQPYHRGCISDILCSRDFTRLFTTVVKLEL